MSRAIEALRSARKRVNPEGVAASAAIGFASPAFLAPMNAAILYGVHEMGDAVDPDVYRILTIGAIALVNTISASIEKHNLKERNFSASLSATTLNIATERPLLSSVGSHVFSYGQFFVLNPVNGFALTDLLVHDITGNDQLLVESATSQALALPIWRATLNTLILQGKIDPVVNNIRKVREKVTKGLKKTQSEP